MSSLSSFQPLAICFLELFPLGSRPVLSPALEIFMLCHASDEYAVGYIEVEPL